jgi:chorismate synthase
MHDNIIKAIEQAKAEGDSLGGTIEAIACNVPVGLGGALFDGIESETARLLFGIPAVKGVEFGLGFDISKLKGSEANDPYFYQNGEVQTKTNHSGGILGGMSTGMPITVRVAVKPTPSIAKEQQTVNLHTKQNATISIKGRHDSCIVPRAVVAVEACLALALLKKINNNTTTIDDKR